MVRVELTRFAISSILIDARYKMHYKMSLKMEPCGPREPMVARVWRLVPEIDDPTEVGDLEVPAHTDTDLKHGDILRLKSSYDRNVGLSIYDKTMKKFVHFGVTDVEGPGADYMVPPQFNALDDMAFCPTYWFAAHKRFDNRGGDNTDDLTWCAFIYYDFSAYADKATHTLDADGRPCIVIDHPRGIVTITRTEDDDIDLAQTRVWRVTENYMDVPSSLCLYL